MFSMASAPFYVPTSSVQASSFSTSASLPSLVISCFVVVAIPGSVKCDLIEVLIWISLMISDVKHLFLFFSRTFSFFIFGCAGSWLLRGLSLVLGSGGSSLVVLLGFSLWGFLLLQSVGPRPRLVVAVPGL